MLTKLEIYLNTRSVVSRDERKIKQISLEKQFQLCQTGLGIGSSLDQNI